VRYDNSASTPLTNTGVVLKLNGQNIQTVITDANGHYEFTGLQAGTYTLEAHSSKPWGGVNASDALLIMKHFAHLAFLTGLSREAADIDGNNVVNAIDALMVSKRFTNLIANFVSGDWKFESHTISIDVMDATMNIKGICNGDVNNSYLPPTTMVPATIDLGHSGTKFIGSFETFELPVITQSPLQTGAVSIILNYPADLLKVVEVRMQGRKDAIPVFNPENGELRIAWYNDKNPIDLNSGDVLFTIVFRANDLSSLSEGYIDLLLNGASEIASINAATISNIELVSPKLMLAKTTFGASVQPNPVMHMANLLCSIPEDGTLTVQLFDVAGNLVKVLADGLQTQAGTHKLTLDATDLPPGVYSYRVMLQAEDKYYQTTHKIVVGID
jgi:hypothetical protein